MPDTPADFHANYQRDTARDAARLLRQLDDRVRAAVIKHYATADLSGGAAHIDRAVDEYRQRLIKCAQPAQETPPTIAVKLSTPLRQFAANHGIPFFVAVSLRRLADDAGLAMVRASNGDPHPYIADPKDKNANARAWKVVSDATDVALTALAREHGFTGIEYNGLYPHLIKDGQDIYFPPR